MGRKKTGIGAFVGLMFIVVIVVVIGLFMQPIFGSVDAAADVSGSAYEDTYNGTAGLAEMVYSIWPVVVVGVGLLCLVVVLAFVGRSPGRRGW